MARGKYIVIEGPEGVGKEAQVAVLGRRLRAAGIPVRILSGTDSQADVTTQSIEWLIQDPRYPMNTNTEVLLYNAARAQALHGVRESLEQGVTCLVSHNYLTTLANHYYGRGDVPDYETINRIIAFAADGIEPDLCIVLDAPVNILMEQPGSHDPAFLERARAGYLWEARQRNCTVVFATEGTEKVSDTIWEHVRKAVSLGTTSRSSTNNQPMSVKDILASKQAGQHQAQAALPATTKLAAPLTELQMVAEVSDLIASKIRSTHYARNIELPHQSYRSADSGAYRYHIPHTLDEGSKSTYISHMDQVFSLHASIVTALAEYLRRTSPVSESKQTNMSGENAEQQARDVANNVLPTATETTVAIYASSQELEDLLVYLLSDELTEAKQAGSTLLCEADKIAPGLLSKVTDPERGGATIAYQAANRLAMQQLGDEYLPNNHTEQTPPVNLTAYWPRNELDLVTDILYEFSDRPLPLIQAEVSRWTFKQKSETYRAYMGERLVRWQKPGRALEKMHYSWDIVSSYAAFRAWQGHRAADDLEWQALSPRLGYDMPDVIEQAGLSDDYERCFELSLELYSTLQRAGFAAEAQYAILQGHRMRWKVTHNAHEIIGLLETLTNPQENSAARELALAMHQALMEIHPLLAEQMKFINKEADPTLMRLAAERYAQFKLSQIDSTA